MLMAYLTLLSGLLISGVAIFYSVSGLTSIFSAAAWPIIIMGSSLEVAKLVATVWLKQNWSFAPRFLKAYLLIAVVLLMGITSMGIFGYLSKAHSDQSLVSGDATSKVAIYDEKIKTARENVEANRKTLKQLDEAVDQVMARSTTETGATKSVQIRKSQQGDRTRIAREIEAEQQTIARLTDESIPLRADVRKVEAEVGPIKYIAAFIYGDNPTENVLEKAVTWVIILIVAVFDPLAIMLLLASQYSFQQLKKIEDDLDKIELGGYHVPTKDDDDTPQVVSREEAIVEPDEDPTMIPLPDLGVGVYAQSVESILPELVQPIYEELNDDPLTADQDLLSLESRLDAQESIFPENIEHDPFPNINHNAPVPLDILFPEEEDRPIREFFERGREVARRLDAGESLEGIPGAITQSTVDYEFIDEEYEPDFIVPEKEEVPSESETIITEQADEVKDSPTDAEKLASAGYVQNEEQNEGGLWSKIATGKWDDIASKPITEPKYLLMSKLRNSDVQ
jgi:hypothetical protein